MPEPAGTHSGPPGGWHPDEASWPAEFLTRFFRFLEEARAAPDPMHGVGGREYRFLTFAANFVGLSTAERFADLWVLYELGGKRDGYFVEIGGGNTQALETHFGWRGALAEPDAERRRQLAAERTALVLPCPGSRALDEFLQAAGAPAQIDYLSLDAGEAAFAVLARFDFASRDISLLTVAHKSVDEGKAIDKLLSRAGYSRRFARFSGSDGWYAKGPAGPVRLVLENGRTVAALEARPDLQIRPLALTPERVMLAGASRFVAADGAPALAILAAPEPWTYGAALRLDTAGLLAGARWVVLEFGPLPQTIGVGLLDRAASGFQSRIGVPASKIVTEIWLPIEDADDLSGVVVQNWSTPARQETVLRRAWLVRPAANSRVEQDRRSG
jgi:hypothetical protein